MRTRTGGFRIGFRGGWTDWQKDFAGMARWGAEAGFEAIDLGPVDADAVKTVRSAGVDVVSVDLLDFPALLSVDAGKRRDAIDRNIAHFKAMAPLGVRVFFCVIIPEKPDADGKANFDLAVRSYGQLAEAAAAMNCAVAVEGWPGMPPYYANICCNPEQCRAIFREVPGPGIGINFDPSHLIRMGIDHVRFVEEFADRIRHVHGKDTEILTDKVYDVGLYQRSIFDKPAGFGEDSWRYTIPGHGLTRWSHCFRVLEQAGFDGVVSVELEDGNYNGTERGEKQGLAASLAYLATV